MDAEDLKFLREDIEETIVRALFDLDEVDAGAAELAAKRAAHAAVDALIEDGVVAREDSL